MADRSGNISLKPMVSFNELPELVWHFIAQHQSAGSLCLPGKQHELGGDHGGGSSKVCFQLGNMAHPNSVGKTIPFLVFKARTYQ